MDTTTALIVIAASAAFGIVALVGMSLYAARRITRRLLQIRDADIVVIREDRAAARGRYIIR